MKKSLLYIHVTIVSVVLLLFSCERKNLSKIDNNNLTPKTALQQLLDGNKRYVNNKSNQINRDEIRRKEIVEIQLPFAVIVGCSDSRVSPEIIFDEGLGHLFVVRVAGNVIGEIELESIEYGALDLSSALILILGHENCGAVNAVIKNQTSDLPEIAKLISPAIQSIEKDDNSLNLERAIKTNALNMKAYLEKNEKLQKLIHDKKIEIHAAYYNLKTGIVELLSNND